MNKERRKAVRVGFSPYTYARVVAMRSSLLREEDYQRLLKMGYHEVLRFLADSNYKQEIENLDFNNASPKQIEIALNANALRTLHKLQRISQKNMHTIVMLYLLKYDIENIKIIIRGKFSGARQEDIEDLLYSADKRSADFLNSLSKKNLNEIISSLSRLKTIFFNYKPDPENLFEIENALDKAYYTKMYMFAQSLKGEGKKIIPFINQEIEIVNIQTILRLKLAEIEEREIKEHIFFPSKYITLLVHKKSIEEIIEMLRKNDYTALKGDEENLLEHLEIDLNTALLRKQSLLLHKEILSIGQIMGFLFAKEIEVKNLKTILKSKLLAINQDYVEKLLVISR